MPIFTGLSFAALVALVSGAFAISGLLGSQDKPVGTDLSSFQAQSPDSGLLAAQGTNLTLNLDTLIATGKTLTLGQLLADPTTNVLQLTGDLNSSGTLLASGGASSLSNTGLTIDNNLVCTATGCIGTGAAAAGIPANTTLQGNTFNGADQLVQLNAAGFLPALNGSNLTSLNATNLTTGTISDSRLSTTVTLQGNTFNSADQLVQLTAGGLLPVLSGANLTALNASNITTGSLSDGRLSSNVALLAGTGPQVFTGNNRFNGTFLSRNTTDSTTAFQIQNAAGTSNLLIANTTSSRIAIGQATAAYTLDVAGDINSTTGIRVGGALLCEVGGCTAAGGSGSYIQNSTALQTAANFNVESAATTSVTGVIRALTGQTADLLQLKNQAAVNIVTIGPTGNVLIQPSTNSTTGFQVFNADATSHLIGADTLNARVAIAKPTPPDYTLDVGGDINTTTGLRVAGNLVCSTTCTPGGGSGNYVQNGTALQTANFAIQSAANGSVVALIRGASGQSADLLDLVAGDVGLNVVTVAASGATLFKNSADSTTAFQIQNAASNPYLLVNTSGASISVGNTSIASTVQIGNTTGAVAQTINIGNNSTAASATTVVLGSTIGTSSTTIQGGTGDILLNAANIAIGPSSVAANGVLTIGTDTGTAAGGLYFGTDTNLYRVSAGYLKTDTALQVGGVNGFLLLDDTGVNTGGIRFGATQDTNLYRSAGDTLKTDDSLVVATNFTGNGTALFKNSADSTTAFQIQDAAGINIVQVDTTTDAANLVTNGSFEVNTTGWTAHGSSTLSRTTSSPTPYLGLGQLKVVTTAAANDGTKYAYALATTTQYTLTAFARLDSGSAAMATFQMGRADDGATDTSCLTAQTLVTTGWTRFTCTFTTGATSGSPYVYFKQTDATAHTFYLDAVKLEAAATATPYREGVQYLNGVIGSAATFKNQSDSTAAFQVQNSAGTSLLTVDTTNTKITLGSAGATPVLLVLGTKNTSGDPTCAAGAVYYNSSQPGYEQAKVCLGGAWVAAGAPYVTSLPTTPADGDEVYYQADATNGVVWHLRYNAGSASTYKWEYLGGSPLTSYVATSEGTNSVTYAALPTAGPSITIPREGDYWIKTSCITARNGAGTSDQAIMSYDIGGTGAVDADELIANFDVGAGNGMNTTPSRAKLKTGLAASTAITAKYRVSGGNGAFLERTMEIVPVRIK